MKKQHLPPPHHQHNNHHRNQNKCSSSISQVINAPPSLVWSLLRRFDQPQRYKMLIKSCTLVSGSGNSVGSLRKVTVNSGLPATTSIERLDVLDDDNNVMVVSIVGGDHKLNNYTSTIKVCEQDESNRKTVVIESYVADVPTDSNDEDTCVFVDTIIGYNLKSLARLAERTAGA